MEENVKNIKVYFLMVLVVMGIIILALGMTYGYWRVRFEKKVTCLNLVMEENDIKLVNAYPLSDIEGQRLSPIIFKVENKCGKNIKYKINLESMKKNGDVLIHEYNRLEAKYVKFQLNEKGKRGVPSLLSRYKEFDDYFVNPSLSGAYEAHRILDNGVLGPNASKTYELRLWLDSLSILNDNLLMDKILVGKINVISG